MTAHEENTNSVAFFSEISTLDRILRSKVAEALPKGMELSHFAVLNHLAGSGHERAPAQLAKSFHVTRGAMTNTLRKLEWSGYIHIRPDWDDARGKWVSISPSGRQARDAGLAALTPLMQQISGQLGQDGLEGILPMLRRLRMALDSKNR